MPGINCGCRHGWCDMPISLVELARLIIHLSVEMVQLGCRVTLFANWAAEADDLPDSFGVLTRCLARNDASEAVSDQRNFSIFTAM